MTCRTVEVQALSQLACSDWSQAKEGPYGGRSLDRLVAAPGLLDELGKHFIESQYALILGAQTAHGWSFNALAEMA